MKAEYIDGHKPEEDIYNILEVRQLRDGRGPSTFPFISEYRGAGWRREETKGEEVQGETGETEEPKERQKKELRRRGHLERGG